MIYNHQNRCLNPQENIQTKRLNFFLNGLSNGQKGNELGWKKKIIFKGIESLPQIQFL